MYLTVKPGTNAKRKNTKSEWVNRKSNHRRCYIEKSILKNFAKFTGKHLCRTLSFDKVAAAGLRSALLLKKKTQDRCFSVNFARFLRTSFDGTPSGDCFYNHCL